MANNDLLPIEKSLAYIREKLTSNFWKEGDALPSTRALAALIGCSSATVVKALSVLSGEGLVSTSSRQKARVGNEHRAPTPPPARMDAHNRVREKLEQDLLTGRYSDGRGLPTIKELQVRYGVCYRTMRLALDALTADGSLIPEKKHYRIPTLTSEAAHATVRFISMRGFSRMYSAINQEQNLVTTLLERACAQRGLRLDVSEVDFYDWTDVRRMISVLGKRPLPLGFIFDVWWYTTAQNRQHHLELLDRIAAMGVPVTILDELGDFELPQRFSTNPVVQVFRIEGKGAGERMAGLHLDHGHKKVAYISSSHFFSWSQRRLEGLQDRFGRAGFSHSVLPIVSSDVDVMLLFIMATAGFDDATLRSIVEVGRTRHQAEDQFQAIKQFKRRERAPRGCSEPEATDAIHQDLHTLGELLKRGVTQGFFQTQVGAAMSNVQARAQEIILWPLFEQALAQPEATAWICASDGIAFAAAKFLQDRKIAVPETIAVSGFDNSHAYNIETGLTSFDFNAQAFVHLMLNFISRPPKQRLGYRHRVIEVEGMVIERRTTRRRALER